MNGSAGAFVLAVGRALPPGVCVFILGTLYEAFAVAASRLQDGGDMAEAVDDGGGDEETGGDEGARVFFWLVRALNLRSRSSTLSPPADEEGVVGMLRRRGAKMVVGLGVGSMYIGAAGLRCSLMSPWGALRTAVALLLSWWVGVARRLFRALKRLNSRASRRALSMTPLPVSIFVLEPELKVSSDVLAVCPCASFMRPVRGSRGTVLASTILEVCLARSVLMPSIAALRTSASASTSFWLSARSFL